MVGIKKSWGAAIALLLLLSFSVTILPLDFLHNHKTEKLCSEARKTGTCHHKLHLSEKSAYCWICAIHFDKTFTKASFTDHLAALPIFSVLSENRFTSFFVTLIFTSLRGPPAE